MPSAASTIAAPPSGIAPSSASRSRARRAGQVGVDDQIGPSGDTAQRGLDRVALAAAARRRAIVGPTLSQRRPARRASIARASAVRGACRQRREPLLAVLAPKGNDDVGMPKETIQPWKAQARRWTTPRSPTRLDAFAIAARARRRRPLHRPRLPAGRRPDPRDAGAVAELVRDGSRARAPRDRPGNRAAARASSWRPADRGAGRARAPGRAGAGRRSAACSASRPKRIARDRRARSDVAHGRRAAEAAPRRPAARGARHRPRRPRRKLRAALARDPGPAARGLLLNRGRAARRSRSRRRSAASPAGDPRRWRDASRAARRRRRRGRPGRRARRVRGPAADRRGRRAGRAARARRHGRGRPGRARRRRRRSASAPSSSARPARREYVAALEPLPDAPDEEARLPRARDPVRAAGAARGRRSAAAARAPRARRRSAATCTATRPGPTGKASAYEMGVAARERGYEYLAICDHTASVGACPGSTPTASAARARRSPPRTSGSRRSGVLRGTECDILPRRVARPARRRPRRARLGAGQRPRRPARNARAS